MARVPRTVDEYIEKASSEARPTLTEMRGIVRHAAPEAVEGISYGMPYYRLHEESVVGFAAFRRHVGMYGSLAGHERDFAGFETEKGTVRFPLGRPLPSDLIAKFVKSRVAAIVRGQGQE